MNKHIPHTTIDLICPKHQTPCEVSFQLDLFTDAEHGVEAEACSEFIGPVTCNKDCEHAKEALAAHVMALAQHRYELGQIGPNVIG